jgi:hypothetical protein
MEAKISVLPTSEALLGKKSVVDEGRFQQRTDLLRVWFPSVFLALLNPHPISRYQHLLSHRLDQNAL